MKFLSKTSKFLLTLQEFHTKCEILMDKNFAKKEIQSSKNELKNIIEQKVNLLSF